MRNIRIRPPVGFWRPYVVRYRFTPFVVFIVPLAMACAAFFLACVVWSTRALIERSSDVLPQVGLIVMSVSGALFFLGAGLSYLLAAVTGRVALRVDSSGVTLG